MSARAIPAEAYNDPSPHGADTQGYQQVLHDLIAMGTDLARLLHNQATTQAAQQAAPHPTQPPPATQQPTNAQQSTEAPPAPASETLINLAVAFDCIARAVRRSILLARSLAVPIPPAADPAQHRAATRRRIIREVEDAIQRTGTAADDGSETLQAELRDRLDAPDLDEDIGSRPIADIISEICRDLGLAAPPGGTHPWKRRTPGDIAQLCADAAAPSGARQPGACQPGVAPQTLRHSAAQPTSAPQPDKPAASPRPPPSPIRASSTPPENLSSTPATILPHPTRIQGRWRPPLQP